MDNSPEGQNNKQKPDLGEGIKPEDVVYSSQDITSKTLAGEGQNYFTRIKRKRPDLKTRLEDLKKQKANAKKERKKLTKKQKILILFGSMLLLILVIFVIVITIILNQPKQKVIDPELQEAVSSAESIDVNSKEGRDEFYEQVNNVLNSDSENSYDAAINLYTDKINEEKAAGSLATYYYLKFDYVRFIIQHGDPAYANTLLDEIDESDFPDDYVRRMYYNTRSYCYYELNNQTMYEYYKDLENNLLFELNLRDGDDHEGIILDE